ncbi:MAG: hypothetical protein RL392_696 [Pseudomonadota bacterium]|jgi:Tfp pilus assembly protein PilX
MKMGRRFGTSKALARSQKGITLVVGMIMLVLVTIIVVSAFMRSLGNLQTVGNMQARQEAIAAGDSAIEQVVSTIANFKLAPGTPLSTYTVDMNNDGVADFSITPTRTCIRAIQASAASASDVELGSSMSSSALWNTEWDISANVVDLSAGSGVAVIIHQGVKVQLSQADKDVACP